MLNKYKNYFILISVILLIIFGLYYFNISYNNSNDLVLHHNVSVEYSEINENSMDITFTDINEKNVNNIMVIYKQEEADIHNGKIIEENISSNDVVTINEIDCNKSIYIVDKENDTMNTLEEFDIPCEIDNGD